MDKIYSRPRIKIPKIIIRGRKVRNTKVKKMTTLLVIFIIAFITAIFILDAILPMFDTLCENRAEAIATLVSNEQATVVMKEHTYDELYTIEKDSEGNISMIKSNVMPINQIISDIANKIQDGIDKKGKENVQIALGSFTGFKLFAGGGPKINIKITPIGNVITDLRSEFIAQGINQTLHRIYLQVDCKVQIVTPFESIAKSISNQVLIMENIIIGKIPETYYNLEGMEGGSDTLNVVQ